jgi:glycolate oxidase
VNGEQRTVNGEPLQMQKVVADLTKLLGPERVLWEPEHLLTYGFDGTAALYGEAGCVALPGSVAEVVDIVRYAAANNVPVITRGSGTGLSGGSVPVAGGIVLCLAQMDQVLELDQIALPLCAASPRAGSR